MTGSTIAAIATPAGSGGIGIVKISGPDAVSIAASLFKIGNELGKSDFGTRPRRIIKNIPVSHFHFPISDFFESHHLYHGHIVNPRNGQMIDEVLLTVMRAPHSHTREDVVEINAHSGPAVLQSILELVLGKGAGIAAPGEFTKRAFLNGRIDLTQAEAVIDIIHARTEKALGVAAAQIRGDMGEHIRKIGNVLIQMLAQTEVVIDFPEDVEDIDTDMMLGILERDVADPLKHLLQRHEDARFLRHGLRAVITGRPNVGKSSLMNAMVRKDRAIVTAIPGTTRDAIEENLNISGIPLILTDTAGLHETDDPIERLGVKKTHAHIRDADIVLLMIDIRQPITADELDIYEKISHKPLIIVANKSDLAGEQSGPDIPESWGRATVVRTSAVYGTGLDMLRHEIAACFSGGEHEKNTAVPNLRHKLALERSLASVSAAIEGILQFMPFELISMDIRESLEALGEITGDTVREDVLDEIFSRFCIGK